MLNPLEKIPLYPAERTCSNYAWDAFSVICFPVGLYRVSSYFLGKALAYAVVPALITYDKSDYRNLPPDQNFPVQSPEGHTLSGRQILYPGSVKWIVSFHGNAACHEAVTIRNYMSVLSSTYNANVVDFNYRGTEGSSNPSCFQDLVNDGIAVVRHLMIEKKAKLENITFAGHSLGGAVALAVANIVKRPVLVQNTFASLGVTVECILQDEMMTRLFAQGIALPAPIELVFRVTYFFFAFLENLITLQFRKSLVSVAELGKSLFFGTILTLTCCCASQRWKKKLRGVMQSHEGNLLLHVARSPRLAWLAKKILSFANWEVDSVANWNNNPAQKFALYTRNDEIIPLPASLASNIADQENTLEHNNGHNSFGEETEKFKNFFFRAVTSSS